MAALISPKMQIKVDFHPVEVGQTAFDKLPQCFDSGDVCTFHSEGLSPVDADVLVKAYAHESIVDRPSVRADDARRIDPTADHRPQHGLGAIPDNFSVNSPCENEDTKDRLWAASASQAWQRVAPHPYCAEVAFINFDHPAKIPALVHTSSGVEKADELAEGVDGLTVEPQKRRRQHCGEVQGKLLHNFSDFVIT